MKLGEPATESQDMMPSMFFELVWNLGFLGVIDGRDRDVGVHRKAAALVVDNRLVAADHASDAQASARATARRTRTGLSPRKGGTAWLGHPFQACRGLRHRSRRAGSQPYVRLPDHCHCWSFIPLFPTIHCTGRNRPSPLQFHVLFLPYHTHYRAHTVAESPQFIRTAQRCHEISLFYLAHTPISTIYIFPHLSFLVVFLTYFFN